MKKRFGFNNSFKLRKRLKGAYMALEGIRGMDQQTPTTAKVREMLETLSNRCELLIEVLTSIGTQEKQLLANHGGGSNENQARLLYDTKNLHIASLYALRDIQDIKGKRKPDSGLNHFIHLLADIWRDAKAVEPKIVHTRDPDSYEGEFLDFVVECLDLGGIRYQGKNAIGKRALRAFEGAGQNIQ